MTLGCHCRVAEPCCLTTRVSCPNCARWRQVRIGLTAPSRGRCSRSSLNRKRPRRHPPLDRGYHGCCSAPAVRFRHRAAQRDHGRVEGQQNGRWVNRRRAGPESPVHRLAGSLQHLEISGDDVEIGRRQGHLRHPVSGLDGLRIGDPAFQSAAAFGQLTRSGTRAACHMGEIRTDCSKGACTGKDVRQPRSAGRPVKSRVPLSVECDEMILDTANRRVPAASPDGSPRADPVRGAGSCPWHLDR